MMIQEYEQAYEIAYKSILQMIINQFELENNGHGDILLRQIHISEDQKEEI